MSRRQCSANEANFCVKNCSIIKNHFSVREKREGEQKKRTRCRNLRDMRSVLLFNHDTDTVFSHEHTHFIPMNRPIILLCWLGILHFCAVPTQLEENMCETQNDTTAFQKGTKTVSCKAFVALFLASEGACKSVST